MSVCNDYSLYLWWLRWSRICLQCRGPGFDPWLGKIPWRRELLPTPVFSPGEFHGQRSLAGYTPWGCRVGHNWVTNTFTFPSVYIFNITKILTVPEACTIIILVSHSWKFCWVNAGKGNSVVVLFSSDHFLHLLEDKQVSQRVVLLIIPINPSGEFFSDKVLELSASPDEKFSNQFSLQTNRF